MSVIRLTKTQSITSMLNAIRADFSLLDDAEIIKMALSKYYADYHIPTRWATPEEERAVKEGREAIERGDYVVVEADEEIDLDKIIEEYEKKV